MESNFARKIGVLFLVIQATLIIYSKFIPQRYFCWAPYDEHTYYEVKVEVDGNELSENEIVERYRYKAKGWEPRAIENVFDIISQYESTYGKLDNAVVVVSYSINGHENKLWKFQY